MTKNIPVALDDRTRYALTDDEILALARWACIIDDHYSAKAGHPSPMDEEGIDSISLSPDAVMKTTVMILDTERVRAA